MYIESDYYGKILETNLYRINYSDSLEELSNATVKLLQNKIVEYKKLFNIEFDEQIIVNYYLLRIPIKLIIT